MTDGISFDYSEIDALAADLADVPHVAGPLINSAIQRTSRTIKDDAREAVQGRRHFKQAARAIDYDVSTVQAFGASVIKSEIGYDDETDVGQLGNLLEFGAPGAPNALTPGNELLTAMERAEDDFEKGLAKAVEDAEQAVLDGSSTTRIISSYLRDA